MDFINREAELQFLKEAAQTRTAGLLVLYGRRRVGKTALLRRFCQPRKHVFYVATQTSRVEQLRSFAEAVQQGFPTEAAGVSFERWEDAFRFLAARAESERIVLVLDEFPYMHESDRSLGSTLQRSWDTRLQQTQLLIILCGSTISVMERDTLGEKSPLFGRRTGQFRVDPLGYEQAGRFFPGADAARRVELYSVLGGIPSYLLQFDPAESLMDNIERRILAKGAFLREEVPFLLMGELREPRIYMALLRAIAEGRTRLGDIADSALGPGSSAKAGFYLQTLQDLRWVERQVPVTEQQPHKSRKSIYRIADPFLRFWFRYVFPYESLLEGGQTATVMRRIREQWSDFVAAPFEEVCRSFVRHGVGLPFEALRVGSWWTVQAEIDVLAVGETEFLCGECKWSVNPVGVSVLQDLQRRVALLLPEMEGRRPRLALFSRSGFTAALLQRAETERILLFDVEALYRDR